MLGFMHLWARGNKLIDIAHELDVNMRGCIDWASYCREICLRAYVDNPKQIGGCGKHVEIDESKFGKRKHWRGHHVEGAWVFGGVERESGKVFMEVVEKRDAETLIPLIQKWIAPGTVIISDCWKAYCSLSAEGFRHLTVNHSLSFTDPEDPTINTNRIECSWRHAKESFSSHGRKKYI